MPYLHLRSLRMSSLETCFSWARKPTWLSRLECCKSMLCSEESRLWPRAVRMSIYSSWWVRFLSEERINLTRFSRHLKLLESMASSTSLPLNLLFWYTSCWLSCDVSKSLRFEPRIFRGCSLITAHYGSSILRLGEKLVGVLVDCVTRSTWKIFIGAFGYISFRATLTDKSSD